MKIQRYVSPQLRSIYMPQVGSTPLQERAPECDRVVEAPRLQTGLISKGLVTASKQPQPQPPAPSTLKKVGSSLAFAVPLALLGAVGGFLADAFFNLGHAFDSVISLGAVGGAGQGPLLAMGVGAAVGGVAGLIVGYNFDLNDVRPRP